MTFEEYLVKKRINREVFAAEDPGRYKAWESMYGQMHPNSFYVAVKMVLNNVRLRYHLREEDVPKPAVAAAPRPAARRAAPAASTEAARPTAIPETPVTIPPATDVPQETSEEKQVTPAAEAKPRPVVRRPASLQKPTTEEAAAAEQPAEGAVPASPRARPVIKRPVIAKPTTNTTAEETAPAQQEPAAPRPRPVIKRPAALAKPAEEPTNAQQDDQVNAEQAIPEAAKPARPRPVIKRPAALQKPTEDSEKTAEAPATGIAPTGNVVDAESQKPPRPRPVIKRPAALQKPVQEAAAEDKPSTSSAPTNSGDAVNPVEPASDTPAGANTSEVKPVADQPAKPPRPRPIIRRPAPPAASLETIQEAEPKDNQDQQETPPDANIRDVPSAGESMLPEEQKPKPPRPRPIMRRPPPKTEE